MAGGADESQLGPATRLVTVGRRAEWTGQPARLARQYAPLS